jgi:hypothetical protein
MQLGAWMKACGIRLRRTPGAIHLAAHLAADRVARQRTTTGQPMLAAGLAVHVHHFYAHPCCSDE